MAFDKTAAGETNGKQYSLHEQEPRNKEVVANSIKYESDTTAYVVSHLKEPTAARLSKAGILPYSCTCPDFTFRRLYKEGEDGNCKHITLCLIHGMLDESPPLDLNAAGIEN